MEIGMETLFKCIIFFTIIQRLYELRLSKRNEKQIINKGGKVLPEKNYIFMVLLHSTWLIGLVYFAFFTKVEIHPGLFNISLLAFCLGQSLRIKAIKALGERWSTRVMILPDAPVIQSPLFEKLRHPNYIGVVLEIAALPLMASLWSFALVFSFLNGIILFFRIRFEEEMLGTHNNYFKFKKPLLAFKGK